MKTRRDIIIGTTFGMIAALGYGATAVLIRKGVVDLAPPLVGATVSLLWGTLILAINTVRSPESNLRQKKSSVGFFLLAGLFGGFGVLGNYFALSLAPVVMVTPIVNTSPLFALSGSYLFLRQLERITPRVILGAILVIVGAILITIGREA